MLHGCRLRYEEMSSKSNVEYIAGVFIQCLLMHAKKQVYYYEDESTPTGTCAVCVVGGEGLVRYQVEKAKYFYIAGFFLTVSLNSIQLVVEHATANNKVFTMNLSAPFICEFFKDPQEKVLPYLKVLQFVFYGLTFWVVSIDKTDNVEEIALKISQWPKASKIFKRITVITQGADPIVVALDGKVKKFPVILLPKEKLVDTTGAGDAFVGGFISQLVQGKPIDECVRAGCYASNVIIQRFGCTYPEKPDFN
ncbi:hypothetical protein Ddye_011137 [Dipteronia dyeriana]|uniref:Adenosine kinase n=1 Tax=Dipteronia dyeriana TaxID=168575 RepID=A0AAD9XEY2_9ROSI|nr:hypothetical protein Ddye_011137 [Dipteronia dyeriana]